MGTDKNHSLRFFLTMCVKDQILGTSSEGLFERLPTKSLTASTLYGHLAVNFLPDLGLSVFLLRLFTDPVA